MKLNFIEVETAIKSKLCAILEQLKQRRNRAERVSNFVDECLVEEEKDLSTQFLQMQKNQLIDFQDKFEATVTFYQSLDSTAQNRKLIWSSRIRYEFL